MASACLQTFTVASGKALPAASITAVQQLAVQVVVYLVQHFEHAEMPFAGSPGDKAVEGDFTLDGESPPMAARRW